MTGAPADVEVAEEVSVYAEHLWDSFVQADKLAFLPPPEPLIADLLDTNSLAFLYGPRGQYKSFVALDWALHLATGSWWHGHAVEESTVLFVAAEGVYGLWPRVEAWMKQNGFHESPKRLFFLPEAVDLRNFGAVGGLAEAAVRLGPKLIVFDTFSRCTVGAEEIGTRDMSIVVEQLDSLRRRTGACILPVHHEGKTEGRGLRGSSVLEAAADTVIQCSATENVVVLKQTKQKNRPEGLPIRLRAKIVGPSVALERYRGALEGEDLPPAGVELLESLAEAGGRSEDGATNTAWRVTSATAERTYYRVRTGLLEKKLVAEMGTGQRKRYRLTDAGSAIIDESGLTL